MGFEGFIGRWGERSGGVESHQVIGGFGADVELVVVAQSAGEDVCGVSDEGASGWVSGACTHGWIRARYSGLIFVVVRPDDEGPRATRGGGMNRARTLDGLADVAEVFGHRVKACVGGGRDSAGVSGGHVRRGVKFPLSCSARKARCDLLRCRTGNAAPVDDARNRGHDFARKRARTYLLLRRELPVDAARDIEVSNGASLPHEPHQRTRLQG